MIERINLIEKERFQLTYTRIVQIVTLVVILCALVYGLRFGWLFFQNKKLSLLKNTITLLEEEKKALQKAAPPKVEGGQQSELVTLISTTPPWAKLVEDISGRLPTNVWLTSMTAGTTQKATETTDKDKDKKKNEPAPPPIREGEMTFHGLAQSAAGVAEFVKNLKDSPYVARVTLKNAEKKENGFVFSVDCGMPSAGQNK